MFKKIKIKVGKKLLSMGSSLLFPPVGIQKSPNLAEYKVRPYQEGETLLTKSVSFPNSHQHSRQLFDKFKGDNNFGKMLEVGGSYSQNSQSLFPEFEYYNLDIQDNPNLPTIVGDITQENISLESGSFDLIVSHQAFEHVNQPWLAAQEITRLLKSGGFCYVSAPWSWRYHPVPIDYWRFSPDCLTFLFKDLEKLEANFNSTSRRVNVHGLWPNGMDGVPIDVLGGWRENWLVYYFGKKNECF